MVEEQGAKGRVASDRALSASQTAPVVAAHPGNDPSRDFLIKRWRIAVDGYGTGVYDAPSRGRALADAWRCDAFCDFTFGQFMRMARCWRDHDLPPRWGDPIDVGGKLAFFVENNSQYVRFVYPGMTHVSNAHPYDVLPVEYRPETYRRRDSDASLAEDPKGLSGEAVAARAEGIAQTPSPSTPSDNGEG